MQPSRKRVVEIKRFAVSRCRHARQGTIDAGAAGRSAAAAASITRWHAAGSNAISASPDSILATSSKSLIGALTCPVSGGNFLFGIFHAFVCLVGAAGAASSPLAFAVAIRWTRLLWMRTSSVREAMVGETLKRQRRPASSVRRPRRMLLLCALCVFSMSAGAQGANAEAPTACTERLMKLAPPATHMPTAADRKRLQGCNSEALYYGLQGYLLDGLHGTPANTHDARLCAFIELADDSGAPLGGAAMLMTIYANGSGVSRNLPLAKHFACTLVDSRSTGDIDRLVQHIDELARSGKEIDVCDSAPGLFPLADFCAAHALAVDFVRMEREERSIVSGWPAARREAFVPLKKAADAYEQKRKVAEVFKGDRSNTQVYLENGFRADFIAMLKAVDSPEDRAAQDPATLDRELNETYRALMKRLEAAQADSPDLYDRQSPASLREAERAWLQYVDAWEAFRAKAYPDVPPDRLRAKLTEARLAALRVLGSELQLPGTEQRIYE